MTSKIRSLKSSTVKLALALVFLASSGMAAPFAKKIQFDQPDGTVVELWGEGDEFYAVFESLDGYTVVFDPAVKTYFYATLSADGSTLEATKLQAGKSDPRALGLSKHLRINDTARKAQVTARYKEWDMGMEVSKRWKELKVARQQADQASADGVVMAPPTFTTTGTKVGLCLLIDFDDDPATVPQAEIVNFCNADSYSGGGNNGSVLKYFKDNANNNLTYSNVVTVYIRIPNSLHPKSWYNDTSKGCGGQGNLLIRDAIAIMTNLPNYTSTILPAFNNLTVDSANQVLACNVFYAGGNGGVWSYGLWPHSWSLYNVGAQSLSPGGKKVYRYQITNIGSSLELGTFCHENGHMLCGFPDIYDYDYDSKGGAGMFCLMNSGGHGVNPVQVCAYLKRAAGWATTTELTSTSSLTATLTASSGTGFNHFYRYAKPGVPTEYFLFENRQMTGRDANLPASGIAVWHIDELGNKDNQSRVSNSTHANYEVTLEQADNLWHFQNNANPGDSQDLYYLGNTASAYNNRFSDGTSPNASWWNGSASSINVSDFSASGNVMTFLIGSSAFTITPSAGLSASGSQGGPFSPSNMVYTLTAGGASLTWSASCVSNWVSVTPSSGALASGAVTNVVVAINANANGMGLGAYGATVIFSNSAGSTQSRALSLTVAGSLADAVDQPSLSFTTSGNLPWFSQTTTTHDGVDAAKSGAIIDSQTSAMQTTVTGPGTISFWWKVSSESSWDYLTFYVDGVAQSGAISGEVDWQQKSYTLTSGSHTLKWVYSKDSSVSSGSDCGWVDQLTLPVQTAPTITTTSPLTAGMVGTAYSQTLAASGGTTPYTWSISAGSLPAGLSLSSAGVISGTAGAVINANFTVRVTGNDGLSSTKAFSLAVVGSSPPTITTSSPLPSIIPGMPYNQTLTASGGTTPYTWSISAGNLPAGLSLSSVGVISGTVVASTNASFTVRVTGNNGLSSTKDFSLAATLSTIAFFDLGSDPGWPRSGEWAFGEPSGGGGTSYGFPDPASGATGTNVFGVNLKGDYSSANGGPYHLTMGPINLTGYSGTQLRFKRWLNTDYMPYVSAAIEVSNDGTNWTTIFINPYSVDIVDNAWTTQSYSLGSEMDNKTTVYIRWGYQVDSDAWTYSGWNIDDVGVFGSPIGTAAPTITTSSPLPSGPAGATYNQTLAASGGTTPYTWSISAGSLPAGLSLSSAGVISGTPSAATNASFTVRVIGNDGQFSTKDFGLTIVTSPTITTSSPLPSGPVGATYNQTLAASGGATPYTWSISAGSLPAGLSLSSAGVISGTAGAVTNANFTVRVTGNDGLSSTKAFSLMILGITGSLADAVDQPSLSFTTSGNLPWISQTTTTHDGVDAARSGTITDSQTSAMQTTVTGPGTISFWWKVSSESSWDYLTFYVDGVAQSGAISGEVDWQQKSYTLTNGTHILKWIYSKDSSVSSGYDCGWVDQLTLPTVVAPTITTASPLTAGMVGTAYSQTLAASGGSTPYTWSVSAGSLPAGLSLSSAGVISGTPSAATTASFTVRVTGNNGQSSTKAFILTIAISGGSLAGAVDQPSLIFTTAGNLPWISQATTTHDGMDAAKSGAIIDGQTSVMQTTVTGPGTISFWWKVSSESSWDYLTFYVDDVAQSGAISGEVDWQQKSCTLASGSHTLKWVYSKDLSVSSGSDCGWVDQLTLPSAVAPTITTVSPLPSGTVGSYYSQTLAASGGTTPYSWSLYSGSLPSGITLSSAGVISGTPSAATTAIFTVRVTGNNGLSSTKAFSLTMVSSGSSGGNTTNTYNLSGLCEVWDISGTYGDGVLGTSFTIAQDGSGKITGSGSWSATEDGYTINATFSVIGRLRKAKTGEMSVSLQMRHTGTVTDGVGIYSFKATQDVVADIDPITQKMSGQIRTSVRVAGQTGSSVDLFDVDLPVGMDGSAVLTLETREDVKGGVVGSAVCELSNLEKIFFVVKGKKDTKTGTVLLSLAGRKDTGDSGSKISLRVTSDYRNIQSINGTVMGQPILY